MRTEQEIYDMIEVFKARMSDHHLALQDRIPRLALEGIYESVILTLKWVLEEPLIDM